MRLAVEAEGAEPAITAVVRGQLCVGLEPADLARFLGREGIRKLSARDLAVAMVEGRDGATTVAAALACATAAGIPVFATGGIGGVHREPAFDESADLVALSQSPVITVCAGAKSILDLPATLERLETLGVTVVGYGTDEFPGFFTARTGLRVPARADTPDRIAAIVEAGRRLGRPGGVLVVQPPGGGGARSRRGGCGGRGRRDVGAGRRDPRRGAHPLPPRGRGGGDGGRLPPREPRAPRSQRPARRSGRRRPRRDRNRVIGSDADPLRRRRDARCPHSS